MDRGTLVLLLYIAGSLCFLAGSLLSLWAKLKG